jgi:5-methylcytosine-specific restriction endonuclease McrA
MRWGPRNAYWGRLTPRMSRLVRQRDKFCVDCGLQGDVIHHIIYRMGEGNRGEFADPSDVVLLCDACHGIRHREKSQGMPTHEKGRLGTIDISKVRQADLAFWNLIEVDMPTCQTHTSP